MKLAFLAAVAALAVASPAMAATNVVVPNTGGSGTFAWSNGLGPIDQINGTVDVDNIFFAITANAGDLVNATLTDCCVAGDQFTLFLNGTQLTPTSVTSPGGNFNYLFANITLAAGTNLFGVRLSALAPGFTDGGASYSFSAVTPGAVPEPATWGMMLLGFGAMGVSLRRRRRAQGVLQAA